MTESASTAAASTNLCFARVEHLREAEKRVVELGLEGPWEFQSISALREKGAGAMIAAFRSRRRALFFSTSLPHTRGLWLWAAFARWMGRRADIVSSDRSPRSASVTWIAAQLLSASAETVLSPLLIARLKRSYDVLARKPVLPYRSSASAKPRILFLKTDHWFGVAQGGSIAHTVGMIRGFERLGSDVTLVIPEAASLRPMLDQTTLVELPPQSAFRRTEERPEIAYNVTLAERLPSIVKSFKPDVIYQRSSLMNFSGAQLAARTGLPFVLEFNGSFGWVHRHWGRPLRYEEWSNRLENISFKRADRIIAVSEVLRDQLIDRRVPAEKILVLPNAVEVERFHPEERSAELRRTWGWSDDACVVGFVGTFSQWHGVETLAGAILRAAPREKHLRFLLIGDGPLRTSVETQLVDLIRVGTVRFLGAVPHDQIPAHLAACDALVSPHVPNADGSRFFGSPTKLFEYMAAGRAIVASDLEQIGTILKHNETALLVKPSDVGGLAKALETAAKDAALRERLAEAAREESLKYTWEANAHAVLDSLFRKG